MTEQYAPLLEEEVAAELLTPEDVETEMDFSKFMDQMGYAFIDGKIELQHVSEYIVGVARAVDGIEDIAKDQGIELPGPIDWKWMALIMSYAINIG